MIFGSRETAKSKGAILAEDVTMPEGKRLEKGTVLGPYDIARLTMANINDITVAVLEEHDVDAPTAALKIAQAMVPHLDDALVRIVASPGGSVSLIADAAGVVGIDTAALVQMNLVEGAISIVTVPQLHRVAKGDEIARVKILTYGVKRSSMGRVITRAHDVIYVRGTIARTASLVQTVAQGAPDSKGEAQIRMRLNRLGVQLLQSSLVPHSEQALAEAITEVEGDVLLIMTATPTQDIDDLAPRAILAAGGVITRLGLPVAQGAHFFAGGLGSVPILGLPTCMRDPEPCGADLILERLICGVPITDEDIARLSVGGLVAPR
jgi:molybdenum cofactor cytidylyltransferase